MHPHQNGQDDMDIVYSTEHGRMCPKCGKPAAACLCRIQKTMPKTDGTVVVKLEKKGRSGKEVTIVSGMGLDNEGLCAFAQRLKKRCGCGGTVKNFSIELQGDRRDTLVDLLKSMGHTVKQM
ncbi:MAG: stress response translation initiation inhibitor YciH [Chitinivibrionales bacterium]|nr:stress response translation initiation inhibitor YciH [Chitinivibrionales bacterium]